jgi:hypothetical protein
MTDRSPRLAFARLVASVAASQATDPLHLQLVQSNASRRVLFANLGSSRENENVSGKVAKFAEIDRDAPNLPPRPVLRYSKISIIL